MAVSIPLFRELAEMLYQWEERFGTDDRRFRQHFRLAATKSDQAAADSVEWTKRHYGRGASAPAAGS